MISLLLKYQFKRLERLLNKHYGFPIDFELRTNGDNTTMWVLNSNDVAMEIDFKTPKEVKKYLKKKEV